MRAMSISYNGGPLPRDHFGMRAPSPGAGFIPAGITAIVFHCPNANRICEVPVTLGPPSEQGGVRHWHWDGNMDAPTVTPSIGCDARCGWHGHINAGLLVTT